MDLHEALNQISEIRQQVARTETYRGFRSAPVAFSGFVAWFVALIQLFFFAQPADYPDAWLVLWCGTAFLNMVVTGIAMWLHYHQSTSSFTKTNTLTAIAQFGPSLVAGGLLALVLYVHSAPSLWMLPGLWAMLFGLGIFASHHLLPREMFWVGAFYVGAGLLTLMWAQGEYSFSPWAMAIPFGTGQFLSAAILYWTLERNHGDPS